MTVVDFMSLVRELPMKKMGVDTLEDIAECISNIILATSSESTRIDIFFMFTKTTGIEIFQCLSKLINQANRRCAEKLF